MNNYAEMKERMELKEIQERKMRECYERRCRSIAMSKGDYLREMDLPIRDKNGDILIIKARLIGIDEYYRCRLLILDGNKERETVKVIKPDVLLREIIRQDEVMLKDAVHGGRKHEISKCKARLSADKAKLEGYQYLNGISVITGPRRRSTPWENVCRVAL